MNTSSAPSYTPAPCTVDNATADRHDRESSAISAGAHCYLSIQIKISKAFRMARVDEGSHRFTCHPHAYPRTEWAILPLPPAAAQYSLPVLQRVGGWVGLGGWLHTEVVCPPEDGHLFQCQPTDSAATRPNFGRDSFPVPPRVGDWVGLRRGPERVSAAVVPELNGVVPAAGEQDVLLARMIDDAEDASSMTVHLVSTVPEPSPSSSQWRN